MSNNSLGSFGEHIKDKLSYKYQIENLLGKGGMANVYKAIQKGLDRDVAVKVIHPSLIHDEESIRRFRLEAKSSAKLNHNNIITIYDVDEVEDILFLTLEYLEGEDLSAKLKKKGIFEVDQVSQMMQPVADALNYIHKKSMVHRDIKSSNIFITSSGKPVVMDFGIASLRETSSGTITNVGTVIGTPEFMSPEQASGYTIGPASDIYSLGVVIYQCLSGKLPFSGETAISTIVKISSSEPTKLDQYDINIPSWMNDIVFKCLAKAPEDRFHNALELKDALKNKVVSVNTSEAKTQKIETKNKEKNQVDEIITAYAKANSIEEKINILEKIESNLQKSINADKELKILKHQLETKNKYNIDNNELISKIKAIENLSDLKNLTKNESISPSVLHTINKELIRDIPGQLSIIKETLYLFDQIENKLSSTNDIINNYVKILELADHIYFKKYIDYKNIVNVLVVKYEDLLNIYLENLKSIYQEIRFSTINFDMVNNARNLILLTELTNTEDQYLKHFIKQIQETLQPYKKTFLINPGELELNASSSQKSGKDVHHSSNSQIKQGETPEVKESKNFIHINFDEEFQNFINQNISGSSQVKELLSVESLKLEKVGNSRLLYLFFSPKPKNNGFDLIFRNHYPLKSKIQIQVQSVQNSQVKIENDGKVVQLEDINIDKDLSTTYGKDLWDSELKAYLKKIKNEEPIECSETQKRNILQMNFNNLMLQLKPYLLATITNSFK